MPLIGHSWSLLRRPFAFLESLRTMGRIVRVDIGKMPVYLLTKPVSRFARGTGTAILVVRVQVTVRRSTAHDRSIAEQA